MCEVSARQATCGLKRYDVRMSAELKEHARVRIDGLDYESMFGFTRLFRCFHMALHPAKLLLSLLLVILLYLGGLAMDVIWGTPVYQGEVVRYVTSNAAAYNEYLMVKQMNIDPAPDPVTAGIFETILDTTVTQFSQFVSSAVRLEFGVSEVLAGEGLQSGGVIGAVGLVVLGLPGWLFETYPAFLGFYLFYAFLITAALGGAVTRIAAVEACQRRRISAVDALLFSMRYYHWLILTVIIPFLIIVILGLIGGLAGAIFFNFPVLDIVGGLLFPAFLLGGLVVALLIIALAVSIHVMMPAVAVERVDAFDAISRAFNYSMGQIWRVIFYNAVMIVFGAVTYLVVAAVIFLTLHVTHTAMGFGAFTAASADVELLRYEAIWPGRGGGRLIDEPVWDELGMSGKISAAMVLVWVKLLVFLLPAYAFSYYFCAQTWIYLLLRRAADGMSLSTMPEPNEPRSKPAAAPGKVEGSA